MAFHSHGNSGRSTKYHDHGPVLRGSFRPLPLQRRRNSRHATERQAKLRHRETKECGSRNLPAVSSNAVEIDGIIKRLSFDQLLDRYHELVDMRLTATLRFREAFELERVEARLRIAESEELDQIQDFQNAWQRERDAWIASAEHLLARLKAGT